MFEITRLEIINSGILFLLAFAIAYRFIRSQLNEK